MTLHYFEEVCVLHNPVAARPEMTLAMINTYILGVRIGVRAGPRPVLPLAVGAALMGRPILTGAPIIS